MLLSYRFLLLCHFSEKIKRMYLLPGAAKELFEQQPYKLPLTQEKSNTISNESNSDLFHSYKH